MGRFKHVELISLNYNNAIGNPVKEFKLGTHFIAQEVECFGVKYFSVILKDHIGNLPVECFKII